MIDQILQLSTSDFLGIGYILTPFAVGLAAGILKLMNDVTRIKQEIKDIKEYLKVGK